MQDGRTPEARLAQVADELAQARQQIHHEQQHAAALQAELLDTKTRFQQCVSLLTLRGFRA